jgi:hypothetical protein
MPDYRVELLFTCVYTTLTGGLAYHASESLAWAAFFGIGLGSLYLARVYLAETI